MKMSRTQKTPRALLMHFLLEKEIPTKRDTDRLSFRVYLGSGPTGPSMMQTAHGPRRKRT
jgi:hypothetical protein